MCALVEYCNQMVYDAAIVSSVCRVLSRVGVHNKRVLSKISAWTDAFQKDDPVQGAIRSVLETEKQEEVNEDDVGDEEMAVPTLSEVERSSSTTVLKDRRLLLLLLWRIAHSKTPLLLESSARCLRLLFQKGGDDGGD